MAVGGEELRGALLKNQSPELSFSNKKELGKKRNRSSELGHLGKRNPSMSRDPEITAALFLGRDSNKFAVAVTGETRLEAEESEQ